MPSATRPSPERYSRPSNAQAAADAIPILVDNEYQIFHLSTPPNTVRHPSRLRSTWSRLRSRDLTTWKRDEIEAVYPGKTSESPDADGAWTGCAVLGPDGNMHLFYTGYNLSQDGKQVILHARSNDKQGSNFAKTSTSIRINGDMSQFEDIDFRDAYVTWMESENCYWMIVATRLREGPYWTRGCLALLTSTDLEHWTIDPKPFYAPNDMFCPECPELFSLPNGKWYLVYSRFHAPDAGTVYRISDSPKGPFRTPRGTSGGRFDARRWYAAKSCPKAGDPTRRIYFGWIADKLEGQWSWGGDMGLPREVYSDGSGNLVVEPNHAFLNATFGSEAEEAQIPAKLDISTVGQTSAYFFPSDKTKAPCDYLFEFSLVSQDAASFGILFRTDDDMEGHRLRFAPVSSGTFEMTLSRCPAPLDDFWADQYNLHLPREVDGPEVARHPGVNLDNPVIVTLRSNVLEIFAGGKSISYRLPQSVYPGENGVKENDHTVEGAHVHGKVQKSIRELGLFVEDGSIELGAISLKFQTALP